MSVVTALIGGPLKALLHVVKIGDQYNLVTEDYTRVTTQCTSASHSGVATTKIATPHPGTALIITDIVISAEKRANASVLVQFTDGVETAVIFDGIVTDGPINLHMGFAGRVRGWKDAYLEFTTDTISQLATVFAAWYFLAPDESLSFAEWEAERAA